MSISTLCQELLQWNKHNDQQLHNHVILRSLGKQLGKTPMWGNPKRERVRERFISLKKVISTTT
jgi:diadenosine tetraphosphate (Ap4A) HIT family hydrolase